MLAAPLIGVNCKTTAYYFLQLREIIMLELEHEADNVLWKDYHWTRERDHIKAKDFAKDMALKGYDLKRIWPQSARSAFGTTRP